MSEHKKPTVSVVLLAYNHLDYTKLCVENLYRYTTDVDYELITVNNGSSDGTEEFFNSLPNEKKVSFPKNVGVDRAINSGFRLAEGKYTMNLSNDIVPTSRWLKNLVACMESDPKIGMAVPVCNYSSNRQQITLPYRSMEEMQNVADQYNHSNSRFWEDRLRLVTYTCLFRTDTIQKIGGFDEDFNPGSYDDDAISFRIRRLGYRLVLAADTYVHHFGSVTFNNEYFEDNLAVRNRSLFHQKFGVDSWVASEIDDTLVALADCRKTDPVRILGIGSSCGASLLQIKNKYRRWGNSEVRLFYLTTAQETLADLATICEPCVFGSPDDVGRFFSGGGFDLIVVEYDTGALAYPEGFFQQLISMVTENGRILTTVTPETRPRIEAAFKEKGFSACKNINFYFSFGKTPESKPFLKIDSSMSGTD
ncbi:Glycosyl transferase family 2 [Caprobacter fermentans]|uniref:Glycosyl transferase family 2 n=1 Tax=Caproicibacter fermentans TaxID=2576756 RepID=A0A6N8HW46_9FIRM|nr:Glycosyl transferase family 2 [Caproicibacter fermentans]